MTRLHLVFLLSVAASCTETIDLARDPLENLASIEVVPGDATITITDLAPPHHTLQYQAMGRFLDGSTRDVTALVKWSLDNVTLGAFAEPGLFTASHAAVGRGRVMIAAHGLTGDAALAVIVDATLIDATFPPPGANLFDPAIPVVSGDATRSPQLIYPADNTLMPRAVARTLFQLTRGDTNDAFRVSFENEMLRLAVETGADRWAADGAVQQLLASAGVIAPLRIDIRATAATGAGTVYAGAPISIAFSHDSPGGVLYFWSAATSGIMRGGLDATDATKLYPSSTTCVGCHALSRDGSKLAMGFDNGFSFDLQAIDVASLMTTIAASTARPMGWATYSPDGERMVVANNGNLAVYDARTGAALGAIALPANRFATHPDWSPDGNTLAIALTAQTPNNLDVKAASIALVSHTNGTWGTPQVVVTGSNTNNNYFPRWSPDGRMIAFVHATTTSQGAASAELMLLPATGGTPALLQIANRRVGHDTLVDLANTMPAWGPRIGERAWLAFVSARPYGSVLPAGRGQIWITSLDLTTASDSTSPAFWLPCQDVTVLNNNPVWSNEVITQ